MLTIETGPLTGRLPAIPAKAHGHRLLLAAALAKEKTKVCLPLFSEDIKATLRCILALGGGVEEKKDGFVITPISPEHLYYPTLSCGESGTTARFFLPVAAALTDGFYAEGSGRLPTRPFAPLLEALAAGGTKTVFSGKKQKPFDIETMLPLKASGRLQAGKFRLPGNVSSQFISGLLFALPLLSGDSQLTIVGTLASAPYVEMTCAVLADFGIRIERTEIDGAQTFLVPGGQTYQSPGSCVTEGDWSDAAFYLTAGSFGGPVTVTGLFSDSLQGDRQIVELLALSGAQCSRSGNDVTVAQGTARPFTCSANAIPDLVPVLAIRAAAAKGESRITDCGRLRMKESDRLAETCRLIRELGGAAEALGDTLLIQGTGGLTGGTVHCAPDHRLVMAAAIAAGISENPVTLPHEQAVAKSDPDFFAHLNALGGRTKQQENTIPMGGA